MFVCYGCQGTIIEGDFISTPCPGIQCGNNCNCRPDENCKMLKKRIAEAEISGDDCKLSQLTAIHCGNKSKKCMKCFKTSQILKNVMAKAE